WLVYFGMRWRHAVSLLGLASWGCADPPDTIIYIGVEPRPPVTAAMLHATASTADASWRIEGSDMTPALGYEHKGPILSSRPKGSFTFSFVLVASNADTISRGSTTFELQPDWNWSLEVAGPISEGHSCIECSQWVQSFPVPS